MTGRPTLFTQELFDAICGRIAAGESLRSVCRDEAMPAHSTFLLWTSRDEALSDQYAQARDARADLIFDEMLEIADTPEVGQKTVSKATGLEITEADMIEHRRLRVDTRKWILSRMAPKKYGDKVTQEHTGVDGGPVQIEKIERVIVRPANRDS